MDDATKKMLLTIVTGVAKKAAIVISTALTAHGVAVTGSSTEYIASGLVLLVTLGYGVWTDYLKAIVLSQLEVLKAKSLAQAAALRDGGIKAPDAQAVAAASAKSPDVATLTVEDVKKAAATLPVAVAGATALLVLVFVTMTIATPAMAQKRFVPTGNLPADIKTAVTPTAGTGGTIMNKAFAALAKPFQDLAAFIGDDLDGAIALSTAIPELQDGHGQQCWMAMSTFGKIIKAHPLPLTLRAATDFEALRLHAISANRLCGNAHCTQMFADGVTMAQAASPIPLVGVPQLHDLCAKIPQIALVDPIPVPPTVPPQ